MTAYLTHQTALQYWRSRLRQAKERNRASTPFDSRTGAPRAKLSQADIEALPSFMPEALTKPYHVIVDDPSFRQESRLVACHTCTETLPRGSFVRLSPGISTACVELCLVQLAASAPLASFLQIAYELCGDYRLRRGPRGKAVKADPLTSAASFGAFLERLPSIRGVKAARQSLPYLCDRSKSPMETDIAIQLRLPVKSGGYGLQEPLLNKRIAVGKAMREVLPQPYFEIDLYWPDFAVGLEYDSSEHHSLLPSVAHDAIRRNGIEHCGIRIVTMTKQQAFDPVEFDRIALILAKLTGKRVRPASADTLRRRAELRGLLYARFGTGRACLSASCEPPFETF